jgi:hypothetical protein
MIPEKENNFTWKNKIKEARERGGGKGVSDAQASFRRLVIP